MSNTKDVNDCYQNTVIGNSTNVNLSIPSTPSTTAIPKTKPNSYSGSSTDLLQ
eukprot:UN05114